MSTTPDLTPAKLLSPDRLSGALALYALLASVVCFWRLGSVGLIHMEGMIVDGARHMLESGDWLVPRVYDEIYTYKPALGYWLAALVLPLADPPPEWLVRLPFAATGFVMGLGILLLVAKVSGPRTGLIAALASISGGLFVQHVRLAEFDVPLAAGVGIAVAAACIGLTRDDERIGLWIVAYGGLTVGFLAKGLPALMCFCPGLVAAAWSTRRLPRLFGWRHLLAVGLFLLASGGYLAGVYRVAGASAFDQPLLESKVRGFSWGTRQHSHVLSADADPTGVAGEEVSARPIDAVLKSLAKPFLIWSSFLPWSLLLPFAFVRVQGLSRDDVEHRLLLAARWFLLVGVLVFLLVPTHKTRYFLPLAAPIGILAALVATRVGMPRRRILTVCATGAILAALAMLILGIGADTPPVPGVDRAVLIFGGIAVLVLAIESLRRRRLQRALTLMVVGAFGWLAAESLAVQPRKAAKGRDLRAEAAELAAVVPPGETLWVLGPSDLAGKHASLYFYLDRPIRACRPPAEPPPEGSYCLLSSDRVPAATTMTFRETARVSSPRYTYLVGRCGPPESRRKD